MICLARLLSCCPNIVSVSVSVSLSLSLSHISPNHTPIPQPTLTGAHRTVVHDVPVAVVPERLWPDYQEPDMPDIDVRVNSLYYSSTCIQNFTAGLL